MASQALVDGNFKSGIHTGILEQMRDTGVPGCYYRYRDYNGFSYGDNQYQAIYNACQCAMQSKRAHTAIDFCTDNHYKSTIQKGLS